MTFTEKQLRVLPPIEVGGRFVKRYHVFPEGPGIEPEVEKAAYAILPELLPEPDGTPPATFVVLHRGGDNGVYLNAYSWVWDNALHLGVAAGGQPFLGCPDEDPANLIRPETTMIGCVYELSPLVHERNAWVEHVFGRDEPDLAAYLADSIPDGTTGGR